MRRPDLRCRTVQEEQGSSIGAGVDETGHRPGETTSADVLRLWGEPYRKYTDNERDYWIYKREQLSWRGVVVWLIVPVPLMVPVGHKQTTLEFDKGRLIRFTNGYGLQTSFGCFFGDDVGYRCVFGYRDTSDKW